MLDEIITEVRGWGTKLGLDAIVYREDYKNLAIKIPDLLVADLSRCYEQIVKAKQDGLLLLWVKTDAIHKTDRVLLEKLIIFFNHLGGQGCRPFSSKKIILDDLPSYEFDWHGFPSTWQAFIPEIEKYGGIPYIFNEDIRGKFIRELPRSVKSGLLEASARLGPGGRQQLKQWAEMYGLAERREAAQVIGYLVAIDAVSNGVGD